MICIFLDTRGCGISCVPHFIYTHRKVVCTYMYEILLPCRAVLIETYLYNRALSIPLFCFLHR